MATFGRIYTEAKQPAAPVNDPKKFKKLVKDIAQLTDDNMHTVSMITLAKYIGERDIELQLSGIETMHMAAGHLTSDLAAKRSKISRDLFDLARDKFTPAEYKTLMSSF